MARTSPNFSYVCRVTRIGLKIRILGWHPKHGGIQLERLSNNADIRPAASLKDMAHDFQDSNGDAQQVLTVEESPELNTQCGLVDCIPCGPCDLVLLLWRDDISTIFSLRNKLLTCDGLLIHDAGHEQQPFGKEY